MRVDKWRRVSEGLLYQFLRLLRRILHPTQIWMLEKIAARKRMDYESEFVLLFRSALRIDHPRLYAGFVDQFEVIVFGYILRLLFEMCGKERVQHIDID